MRPETCDDCAFLKQTIFHGNKLFKCINHMAPTKEELMRDCIWIIAEQRNKRGW